MTEETNDDTTTGVVVTPVPEVAEGEVESTEPVEATDAVTDEPAA